METNYYPKYPCLMENDNSFAKYVPVGVCGYLRMSMENFSRMEVGLPSLTLLFLKETQHLHKGQTITSILLMLMVTNAKDVVVIIFSLNVINPNIPILAAMVYIEDMVGVIIAIVEEIVTMEERILISDRKSVDR